MKRLVAVALPFATLLLRNCSSLPPSTLRITLSGQAEQAAWMGSETSCGISSGNLRRQMMKRSLSGFLAPLAIIVSAVCAWGVPSPVAVTHTLTGYSKQDQKVTLEYAVQVQNREEATLPALSLSLVSHPPFVAAKTVITIDRLGPKASTTLKVKVVTPLLLDRDYFSAMPLLWAGRYSEAGGRVVEFPVKSKKGGAK